MLLGLASSSVSRGSSPPLLTRCPGRPADRGESRPPGEPERREAGALSPFPLLPQRALGGRRGCSEAPRPSVPRPAPGSPVTSVSLGGDPEALAGVQSVGETICSLSLACRGVTVTAVPPSSFSPSLRSASGGGGDSWSPPGSQGGEHPPRLSPGHPQRSSTEARLLGLSREGTSRGRGGTSRGCFWGHSGQRGVWGTSLNSEFKRKPAKAAPHSCCSPERQAGVSPCWWRSNSERRRPR